MKTQKDGGSPGNSKDLDLDIRSNGGTRVCHTQASAGTFTTGNEDANA